MFHFEEEYLLQNKKVALVPLKEEHFEALFRESFHKDIWTYFLEEGYGRENFRTYFSAALEHRQKGIEYPFAIKDKLQNDLAGMTRIYAIDNRLKIAKVGHTWIGKRFQGTGLNKNAKYLLFEFLFEQMERERKEWVLF